MITCDQCGNANSVDATFCTQCSKPLKVRDDAGTVDTPPMEEPRRSTNEGSSLELAPGAVFAGHYTIIEKIGQGGMGVVYRAKEKQGGVERELALKLIRADRLADSNAVDRLMSEGMLTQTIRHNNVVAVYDAKVANTVPYVAMEYVDGISLRDWIRRQRYADTQKDPPPLALVTSVLRSILDGLEAAHAKGVVHRDLKPENVMLTADPTPEAAPLKILDFGIASGPGTLANLTGTGMSTPNYRAPEQITNPASANASSDLYSLSKMFYELLMGVLPTGHWQPPSGGRVDVPEAVDRLIMQGLADAQRQRPQSAADYRAALDNAVGEPAPKPIPDPIKVNNLFNGKVPPPPPPPPAGKLFNTPMKIGLGVAGALVLVVGLNNMQTETQQVIDDDFIVDDKGNVIVDDDTGTDGYAMLSGRWNYATGAYLDIRVDADGSFSGSGTSVNGVPMDVAGSLIDGEFTMSNPQFGVYPGTIGAGSNACHLAFETFNGDGSLNWRDVFHIDHPALPNQPCPARFGN